MAGFLVYRDTSNDRNRLPFDIGAMLVNGASGPAALDAAEGLAARLCGAKHAASVQEWTATELNSSDFGDTIENTVFQGECKIPGDMLRGGGIQVS